MGFTAEDGRAIRNATEEAIAFRARIGSQPIGPQADYAQKYSDFDEPLPDMPTPPDEVIARLIEGGTDGLMDFPSPRFFGWVIGGSHPAGTAADILTAGWAQVATMATPTPTVSALEEIVGKWLLDLLRLPTTSSFGVCTGATVANSVALAAGRNELLRKQGWDVESDGLFGAPEITVVVGGEAHSSIDMSLRLLGMGCKRVRVADADTQGRMRSDALQSVLGGVDGPVMIIAQAGNINSGAIDPMDEIADIAAAREAWFHVDGAFGLWAHAHPDLEDQARGMDRADSWAVDGHKWLQVPYDCGFVFVRDPSAHYRAMGHSAAYLPNSETLRDPGDFVPELSRRARGLPVWAVMKAMGRQGLLDMFARTCRHARQIAERLGQQPGITVLNDVRLNQVSLTFGNAGSVGDAQTQKVLQAVQKTGDCFPSHGHWRGRQTVRISVSGYLTDDEDVDAVVRAISTAWEDVQSRAA